MKDEGVQGVSLVALLFISDPLSGQDLLGRSGAPPQDWTPLYSST